jgi:uncharacterized protein YaiL (DUF2058 family)
MTVKINMSSLSDQLLKAGLVSKEQVAKAAEKPKKKNFKSKPKQVRQKQEPSDLAQFYGERKKLENTEKQEIARKKKEAARIKKETNQKINKLISDNLLNDDGAEIRFNFVVGTSIKYLFVTEKQQQDIIDGKLAFTILGGKRCLIPIDTAKEILSINPKKIVIVPN